MKFSILKDVGGDDSFPIVLRKLRLEKRLTKKQLGQLIGKNEQQIQRYESLNNNSNKQKPPLDVFKKICLALQVEPSELLGLKFVISNNPHDVGVIYEWELRKDAIYWTCPNCNKKNITYNDFHKNKKLLKTQQFMCEYDDCLKFYDKLKGVK